MSHDIETSRLIDHAAFVRDLSRSLLRDEHAAADVEQEAWLAMLSRRPDSSGVFRAWIATVVRNAVRQRRRAAFRREARERAASRPERQPSPLDTLQHVETLRRLGDALHALSAHHQEVIVLRYFEGLPPRDIAPRLGLSLAAVKARLRRALEDLRRELDEAHGGGRRAWGASLAGLAGLSAREPVVASVAGLATKGVVFMSIPWKLVAVVLMVAVAAIFVFRDGDEDRPVAAPERTAARLSIPDRPTDAITAAPPHDAGPSAATPAPSLDRDLDLFGVVVDEDGRPIAGARVESLRYPWERASVLSLRPRRDERSGPSSTTHEDGRFALRLDRGEEVSLRVSKSGYATTSLEDRVAGERIEVELQRARTFVLVAKGDSGEPVSDVRVEMWRYDRSRPRGAAYDRREGRTDLEGRWEVTDVAPGPVTVALYHDALAVPDHPWIDVTIPESSRFEHEVVLVEAPTVRGRVTDKETGEPIAGARVGENWTMRRFVVTDDDGYYVLRSWTSGPYAHVHADGYGAQQKRPKAGESLDFTLERGNVVTGRIVGPSGEPVVSALVTAMSYDHLDGGDFASALTSLDGTFSLGTVRVDKNHTLIVMADGYGRTLVDFEASFATAFRIELGDVLVSTGQRIEGVAIGVDGEPLANHTVELYGANDDRGRLRPDEPWLENHVYGQRERRRTDDLGRFRFRDLAPGTYQLSLQSFELPGIARDVTLHPGEDRLDVELRFEEMGRIDVLVSDPSGLPVVDAGVHLYAESKGTLSRATDDEGRASMRGLPDEWMRLTIEPPAGYLAPAARDVTPSDQEISFVVERAPWLEGEAYDPDGNPLVGYEVRATYSFGGGQADVVVTGDRGEFAIACEPDRAVDVELTGFGFDRAGTGMATRVCSPYRGGVEGLMPPVASVRIDAFEIPFDASLSIRVVDPEGDPVPRAQVWVTGKAVDPARVDLHTPHSGGLGPMMIADDDGRVVLDRIPAEALRIAAGRRFDLEISSTVDRVIQSRWTTVIPRGEEITLRLRRGDWLEGVVVAPEGEPASDAFVVASTDEQSYHVRADSEGRFRMAVDPDLVYHVRAQWVPTSGSAGLRGELSNVDPSDHERLAITVR